MFGVVYLPQFSLQAVLRPDPALRSRPLALTDPALPKPIIVQLTEAARAVGVLEGLTASQAMARCGDLLIKSRSLSQEQAATNALLQTAYAFSPGIEATAPGVCTMELKGLGLETSEAIRKWAEQIRQILASLELQAQVGIAATPALALIAARAAKPVLILRASRHEDKQQLLPFFERPSLNVERSTLSVERSEIPGLQEHLLSPALSSARSGREGELERRAPARPGPVTTHRRAERVLGAPTIESFPLSALEPAADIFGILNRWGIHSVGALLALGKDRVVERLGPAVAELFDRVSPDSVRPLKLVVPPETFEEQMDFEQEIETAEPLLFVLRRFVEQLARRLQVVHLVAAELHLRLGLSSGAVYERAFRIPSPTGNIETLFRMLQTHLETVRTEAPIVSLRLEARPCSPEAHQFGLFETTLKDPNQFAETLARLMALCGPDRAGTPVPEATHRIDSFRMKAPEFDQPARVSTTAGKALGGTATSGLPIRDTADSQSALPLRRFRPAVAARVEIREQRPALVRSSVFNGAIADVRGPFLSSGDWWDRNSWSREEWDVETNEGALYRIYRSSDGWFVEGVYD